MSCTKSIVGLALCCLLTDSLIESFDVPISKFLPRFDKPGKDSITIRQLANMTSGIENIITDSIYKSSNIIDLACNSKMIYKPGTIWEYNNNSINLISEVIYKITNEKINEYIAKRIFKPLEINDFVWSFDNSGNPYCFAGCYLTPIDFAKIGFLLLNKGQYKKRIVFDERSYVEIIKPSNKNERYGLLWWINYDSVYSVVDDLSINKLELANLPDSFISKVNLLRGRYSNEKFYYKRIEKIFGNNSWHYLASVLGEKNLKLSRKEYFGNVHYIANGYLGNYLIVLPYKKIIAVRLITTTSHRSEKDDFIEFENLVNQLE